MVAYYIDSDMLQITILLV